MAESVERGEPSGRARLEPEFSNGGDFLARRTEYQVMGKTTVY